MTFATSNRAATVRGVKVVAYAVAVLLLAMLLAACGGDEGARTPGGGEAVGDEEPADTETTETETESEAEMVLPEGGSAPELEGVALEQAARAAGCELKSVRGTSREHTSDLDEEIDYGSAPPTSGKHFQTPAEDGAYFSAPDVKELVHSLEHGRVVIWFKENLPRDARADLRAFYEDDPFQTLLTPDETGSDYEIAATAWNRDPVPDGTGRLLGCERFTPEAFEAIQAFKEKHRSRGPEPVP